MTYGYAWLVIYSPGEKVGCNKHDGDRELVVFTDRECIIQAGHVVDGEYFKLFGVSPKIKKIEFIGQAAY